MKTSSILTVAVLTLATASLLGGGLVRAFPTATAIPTVAGAPYQWKDAWERTALGGAPSPVCPFRKSWRFGWDGPQAKWQRACAAPL